MASIDSRHKFHAWRSSKFFILPVLTFAIFVDIFLSTFAIPILPYILQVRIGLKGDDVQTAMSTVLSIYGLASFAFSPVAGVFIGKFSTRKWPLVIGLIAQIITTCLTASATNMYLLYLSRIFQGAAGSVLRIIALATITDTVGSGDLGKTMGIISPIISSGAFLGPMIGGLLLSSVGYWQTWFIAVLMISLDLTLRLIMIDTPKSVTMGCSADTIPSYEAGINAEAGKLDPAKHSRSSSPTTSPIVAPSFNSPCSTKSSATSSMPTSAPPISSPAVETTPLLPTLSHKYSSPSPMKPLSNAASVLYLLRQRRIASSIILTMILSTAFYSFNTTLALHVQEVFGWGPREIGFLYFALLGPSAMLGPFAGWLRDSIGVRWPTLVGTGLAAPLYVLIGLVGDERFPWTQGELGKRLCIGTIVLMGLAVELTTSTSLIEGTLVIDELEARSPGIFGPQGGYPRFFAITGAIFPLSSLIGPSLSGGLTVTLGYSVMNDVMAFLTFITFLITLFFVGPRGRARARAPKRM